MLFFRENANVREARWANAGRFAGETPADRSLPPIVFALGPFFKSLWRRKVGRGRARDCAPGVSAPSFLQDWRLCGKTSPDITGNRPILVRSEL